MMQLWRALGVIAYYVSWPLLRLYLRGTERTRVLLVHDDMVLVVKHWLGNGRWSLPGGGMHAGEPADIGARRELKEELGFHSAQLALKPLAIEPRQAKDFTYMCHYFMATLVLKHDQAIKPHSLEVLSYAWIKPEELSELNADIDVLRALHYRPK